MLILPTLTLQPSIRVPHPLAWALTKNVPRIALCQAFSSKGERNQVDDPAPWSFM